MHSQRERAPKFLRFGVILGAVGGILSVLFSAWLDRHEQPDLTYVLYALIIGLPVTVPVGLLIGFSGGLFALISWMLSGLSRCGAKLQIIWAMAGVLLGTVLGFWVFWVLVFQQPLPWILTGIATVAAISGVAYLGAHSKQAATPHPAHEPPR